MELITGFPLLVQQTIVLIRKNVLLSLRNKTSTFLELFSSFFFIALLFGIQKSTEYQRKNPSGNMAVTDPKPVTSFPIPPCESKLFLNRPCYDFVWSGSGNKRIESIVKQIMDNNPGRPIPSDKVKGFTTKKELNDWLMNEPLRVPGALHFKESNKSEIRYAVQTNSTSIHKAGRRIEDAFFTFQLPLQFAASREIARSLIQDPKFGWDVGIMEFAHPQATSIQEKNNNNGAAAFAKILLFAATMFGFIFQTGALVLEKELKLRQTMTMMGLYDTAYWGSWLIWETLLTFLSSIFIIVFGMIFQVDLFTKNNFMVVFLLFFLFQLSMIGFAFLLSVFISNSSSTTSACFSVFIIGFMAMFFSSSVYSPKNSMTIRMLWSLFPPNPFGQGLQLLFDKSATPNGFQWSDLSKCIGQTKDCHPMSYYLTCLALTFILWLVLTSYFDNIVPNAAGVRKPYFYCLKPSYWTGTSEKNLEDESMCLGSNSAPPLDHFTPDDKGVFEEENKVKQQVMNGVVDPDVAVQLRGLRKSYPKTTKLKCIRCCYFCCFCKCESSKPFHAVQGVWMNFAKDQLFCMLGPNGAGKTTTIGCLTGIIPVTRGDALIYDNSIRSPASMSNIRKISGICTQFDTLWDKLSSQEHLEIFACIKGLDPAVGKTEAEKLLAEVKLGNVAHVRSGSYSGGMKRRLSVAITLIGDPKLVILDEPTTGMDPITRRHVWDVIEAAKRGRSIILTTHSMEEADILSDRIGIMARGRLRCIGTSTMLKSQFGAGFIVKLSFSQNDSIDAYHDAVKQFFRQRLNVSPIDENKSLTFEISSEKEDLLEGFFEELEYRESEFGILNIQIGLATLEEVFLEVAQEAELETLETATLQKNSEILTLESGVTVEVQAGAKFVQIPGSESTENPRGLMIKVNWKKDDNGNLCIAKHSNEIPVPPTLRRRASASATTTGNVLGEGGSVTGNVLH